jgi:hypothetical protein
MRIFPDCLISGRSFFGDLGVSEPVVEIEAWRLFCKKNRGVSADFEGASEMNLVFAVLGVFFSINLAFAATEVGPNKATCSAGFSISDEQKAELKKSSPGLQLEMEKVIPNLIIGREYEVGSFAGYSFFIIADTWEHPIATMTVRTSTGKVSSSSNPTHDSDAVVNIDIEPNGEMTINFHCLVKMKE